MRSGRPAIDLTSPRSAWDVLATALALYARYPGTFLLLALVVVAPYELIVLAATGAAPFDQQYTSASTSLILTLIGYAVLGPLVSALHVHAAGAVAEGRRPELGSVLWTGVRVLPVVTAAEIVAGIGVFAGLLLFVLPGLVLAARWGVVAQAAAFERTDWLGALRRSAELTRTHYLHVLAILVLTTAVEYGVLRAGELAAGRHSGAGPVALGIAAVTISRSITALTTAVLYFELRGRATREDQSGV
ncbi:MAG TPA: hypothetical protein VE992_07735 [Solirubrobacteraceae bacterium]|nr:hypothetical protein [Solirubrobacteraceae bacterium]